ncbi:MAG: galactokinase, partial [Kiritimatiellia bacterium]|nr:galactokinase [Kiritimatiellia bacterium]
MPPVVAFAPGRVEILGNHTDYNEGFVLSAAIEEGMVFAAGPSDEPGQSCLYAADLDREVRFRTEAPAPDPASRWANYSKGMLHLLSRGTSRVTDFRAVFGGNVPMGAGLSSSAALEVSTGLALARLMNLSVPRLKMAQLAQQAEIEFSGTRCGLLDQISSLYGEAGSLVFTDFRTLEAHSAHMPDSACFLLCNTGVKHSLVDSEYNERRASCEAVAKQLAHLLNRPVRALRDVSPEEWAAVADRVESTPRLRAAHVIGENDRVLRGKAAMERGDVEEFGRCMTASHESSRHSFENSCTELDQAVEAVL